MTNLVAITVKATDSSDYAAIKASAAKAGAIRRRRLMVAPPRASSIGPGAPKRPLERERPLALATDRPRPELS